MRRLQMLEKLRGRSPQELGERVAQRGAAFLERVGWRDNGEPSDATFRARLVPEWRNQDLANLAQARRRGEHPPFVPGVDELSTTLSLIRRQWPARIVEITRAAEEIEAGRFALLGHAPMDIADPVAWGRDPLRGVSAPDVHWSQIDYLDPAIAGDHKLVWELNRHQFLVTLGQAYALTGRERHAERAARLLGSWLDANPPKRGVNWASSLEVAYRSIAWLWALRLMASSNAFTDALVLRLLKIMEVSGRHLERYLSTYFSPNTHLTGEALGLLYLGTQLPELAAATRWRTRGWEILLDQLQRQVRPDGTYFEQATYYQRYTLDIYLHARLLGAAHGLPDVARVDDALRRLANVLAWTSRADGTIPLLGDEDGGRLLFLDGRPGDDVRSPLATVASLLSDPALAHVGGEPSDEVAWLLGPLGYERLQRLTAAPLTETAHACRDGGLYVMRDGWGVDAAVLTIDCGPLGIANGGHAHADTLAFDLAVGQCPVFVDAGTVSYTTSPSERDTMRSSLMHNTVSLDATSSSQPAGPFRWAQMTPGVLDGWRTTSAGALFEGHHDGYDRLAAPARHRRQILAARDGWWLLRDVIESAGGHDAVATFQCATGLDVLVEDSLMHVSAKGRRVVTVRAFGDGGRWVVDDGVASRRYGARNIARRARYVFRTSPAFTAVTFAITRGSDVHSRVSLERTEARETFRLEGDGVQDVVVFEARARANDVRTDAGVVWVRHRASDGSFETLINDGGTMVELEGTCVAEPEETC